MNEISKPNKIYKSYKEGKIDEQVLLDLLFSLIEDSPIEEDRTKSLAYLSRITLIDPRIRSFVENLMLSDANEDIRQIAVRIIFKKFLEKSLSSLSWLIQHEPSHKVIATIIDEIENHQLYSIPLKNILINRFCSVFKVIPEEAEFFIDLYKIGFQVDFKPSKTIKFKSGYQIKFPLFDSLYAPINHVRNGRVISLWLTNRKLSKLPESLGNLKKLKYLYLDNINLEMLPKSIKLLTRLRYLSLYDNDVNQLPESMSSLKKLVRLDLRQTNLTSIPDFMMNIARKYHVVKYIVEGVVPKEAVILGLIQLISKIKLKKISQYDDIHNYDFNHNLWYYKINNLGHIIGIYLFNFETPYLGLFPEQICILEYLEELYLSNNDIQYIPDSIGTLSSLRELDLSWNRIVHIPESLHSLSNLKFLDLEHNEIEKLPEFFNEFISLEYFKCSANKIETFPKIIIENNQKYRKNYLKY